MISHLSEVSGACTALVEAAAGLDPARFDVRVILPGHGPLEERARKAGLTIVVIPNEERSLAAAGLAGRVRLALGRVGYVARLARFLRREKFDLVYVSSAMSVFAGAAARLAGLPVVWHVHETLDSPGRSVRLKMRLVERLSSGILYASRSGEACFPARRVRHRMVARNRVDVEAFCRAEPLSEEERARLGIAPDAALLVTNGLIRRKGADLLIRAYARLSPEVRERTALVILGEAPEDSKEFAASLRRMADALGVARRVIFAGLRHDIPVFMRSAAVYVSASRNEALPIALCEAMAAGVPVIATAVGDCGSLLEEGRLGTVIPPDDEAALAGALAHVLRSPEEAAGRARLAREKIVSLYGGEDFWRPLEEFLVRVWEDARAAGRERG